MRAGLRTNLSRLGLGYGLCLARSVADGEGLGEAGGEGLQPGRQVAQLDGERERRFRDVARPQRSDVSAQ